MRPGKWIGLVMSALLLFAAGCQAVQGIDLNTALKQMMKTTSYEGSAVFELELDLSGELLAEITADSEEAAALIPLMTRMKLELDEIKVKDALNMSMRGTLTLGDIGIGFALQKSATLMVLELDGASAPIVFDLAGMAEEFPEAGLSAEQQLAVQELSIKFAEAVSDYWIGNMPNASDISVELNAPAKVGGKEMTLTRIGIRFDGPELLEWLKAYAQALSEDTEGARAFLKAFETFAAEAAAVLPESGLPTDEMPFGDEEEFELTEDEWIESLQSLSLMLSLMEIAKPELTEAIFGDSLNVRADLYVDGKLNPRKQEMEITYRPDGEALAELFGDDSVSGLEGIRIAVSSELWSSGGDVEPDAPRADGGVTPEEMDEWTTAEALRFFGAGSGVFELLAGRLHMGEQELTLVPDPETPGPVLLPNGRTLVPVRLVAESLEAEVVYDRETRKLIVRDDATGKEIVLTVGSSRAVVNGKDVEWGYPVSVIGGVAYVPGRGLIETLGGTIAWSVEEDGGQVLVLKRDIAELIRS